MEEMEEFENEHEVFVNQEIDNLEREGRNIVKIENFTEKKVGILKQTVTTRIYHSGEKI